MKIMATSVKKSHASTAALSALDPAAGHHQPMPLPESWTLTDKSGSVTCGVTAPFSWVLVHTGFVCALQESVSAVMCKLGNQIPLASKVKFPRGSQSLCQICRLGNLLWVLELS